MRDTQLSAARASVISPKRRGRFGGILEKLTLHDLAGKDDGEKVRNRVRNHCGTTLRHVLQRVAKLGRELEHRRDADGTKLYLRLKPVEKKP